MYEFLNEWDQLFGFGRPSAIKFNTPNTKDIHPASPWTKDKDKNTYHMVARVVGINKEDLHVTIEDYGLCIDGKTEEDGTTYTQHIELPICKDLMANVIEVNYSVKNGLCRITLVVREPDYKKVEVKMIKK